jgi:hypothetical protein
LFKLAKITYIYWAIDYTQKPSFAIILAYKNYPHLLTN